MAFTPGTRLGVYEVTAQIGVGGMGEERASAVNKCRQISQKEAHMPATTFAVPILPGKTEAWKQALSEIKGARKSQYEESRKRMGVTREVVSLQSTPQGDYVVVCLEASDPNTVVSRYLTSDAPFDRWFAETVLKGTHGMDASQKPPPPNQVFMDWSA